MKKNLFVLIVISFLLVSFQVNNIQAKTTKPKTLIFEDEAIKVSLIKQKSSNVTLDQRFKLYALTIENKKQEELKVKGFVFNLLPKKSIKEATQKLIMVKRARRFLESSLDNPKIERIIEPNSKEKLFFFIENYYQPQGFYEKGWNTENPNNQPVISFKYDQEKLFSHNIQADQAEEFFADLKEVEAKSIQVREKVSSYREKAKDLEESKKIKDKDLKDLLAILKSIKENSSSRYRTYAFINGKFNKELKPGFYIFNSEKKGKLNFKEIDLKKALYVPRTEFKRGDDVSPGFLSRARYLLYLPGINSENIAPQRNHHILIVQNIYGKPYFNSIVFSQFKKDKVNNRRFTQEIGRFHYDTKSALKAKPGETVTTMQIPLAQGVVELKVNPKYGPSILPSGEYLIRILGRRAGFDFGLSY